MKNLILFFILVAIQHLSAQDSIFKRNKDIIAAKIEEVNPTEIKYKKLENLSGPLYLLAKSEIFRIKYSNGSVDTLNLNTEVKPQIVFQNNESGQKNSSGNLSLVTVKLSDRELNDIIKGLPVSETKEKMLGEYNSMMKYKRNQYLSDGLGWGIGFAVPFVVTVATIGNYDSFTGDSGVATIFAGAIVGAAIRTTGQVLRKMNKNKKQRAKQNILRLYDE